MQDNREVVLYAIFSQFGFMKKHEFLILWNQYQNGIISDTDRVRLAQFIKKGGADEFLREWMSEQRDAEIERSNLTSQEWSTIWDKIQVDILAKENTTPGIIVFLKKHYRVAAAAVLAGVFISALLYKNFRNTATSNTDNIVITMPTGKNGPALTLADGTIIKLDTANSGKLANGFSKDRGSLLVAPDVAQEATLTIPYGRTQSIVLADGTQVWLNAGSSIRFPTKFSGARGMVSITGEAYFEVTKDKTTPFIVNVTNDVQVKVYGTRFNVNSYKEEGTIKTTLLEGSIALKTGSMEKMVKPGQQAQVNRNSGSVRLVDSVNIYEVTAWKDGLFRFDGTDLQTIMKRIGRWYNVEVEFRDRIEGEFVAKIPNNESLQKVLALLESTKQVHFITHNRKIIVTK